MHRDTIEGYAQMSKAQQRKAQEIEALLKNGAQARAHDARDERV